MKLNVLGRLLRLFAFYNSICCSTSAISFLFGAEKIAKEYEELSFLLELLYFLGPLVGIFVWKCFAAGVGWRVDGQTVWIGVDVGAEVSNLGGGFFELIGNLSQKLSRINFVAKTTLGFLEKLTSVYQDNSYFGFENFSNLFKY